MKNRNLLFVLVVILIGFAACNEKSGSSAAMELKSEADTVAVALGYSIGENIKAQFPDISADILAKSIVDAFNGGENPLFETPQEADMAIRTYMRKESERKAEGNQKAGEDFLAENAKRSEVKVTESGLQYEVLVEGNGPKPTLESTVSVHYHGTTIDGTVFDSSVDRGEPTQFPLNGVIKGWTEGLQLMNVGSKYKFYIPSDLAYGPRGAGAQIGPNSALIFEVELLEILN